MKYYANILNPFSPLLTKKLEEIGKLNLPIDIIATSHGAIWRDDPLQIVKKYAEWANAYLIEEGKNILVDTIWTPHRFDFVENLKKEIDLTKIDAVIANHGECDHSGSLTALMAEIPDVPIYCTANAVKSIDGQYGKRGWNFHVVKTGDSLDIGNE